MLNLKVLQLLPVSRAGAGGEFVKWGGGLIMTVGVGIFRHHAMWIAVHGALMRM